MAISVTNYQEKRKIIGNTLIIQVSFDIQLTSGTSGTYSIEFNNLQKYIRKLRFRGLRIKATPDTNNSSQATIQYKHYSKRNLLNMSDYYYLGGSNAAPSLNTYSSTSDNTVVSFFTDYKIEFILSTDIGTPKWSVLITLIISD